MVKIMETFIKMDDLGENPLFWETLQDVFFCHTESLRGIPGGFLDFETHLQKWNWTKNETRSEPVLPMHHWLADSLEQDIYFV